MGCSWFLKDSKYGIHRIVSTLYEWNLIGKDLLGAEVHADFNHACHCPWPLIRLETTQKSPAHACAHMCITLVLIVWSAMYIPSYP